MKTHVNDQIADIILVALDFFITAPKNIFVSKSRNPLPLFTGFLS
jgi:hypothetical protein